MARITRSTDRLYGELVAEDAWTLSKGQLQQAVGARLGPLPNAPDPVAHWRAVGSLATGDSQRLPDKDCAAIDLALAGFPCIGLREAVKRLLVVDEPHEDPEVEAEKAMQAALTRGDDKPYGARLAERMLAGAVPSRPGLPPEKDRHERIGQAQAVATTMIEVAEGAPLDETLDADDMAQVFGLPVELVGAFLRALSAVFGNTDTLTHIDEQVDGVSLDRLVAALAASASIVPLYEDRIGVPLGSGKARHRFIAQGVPLQLVVSQLHGALISDFGSVEVAAASRSLFPSDSTAFIAAQESVWALNSLDPRPELPDPDS